MATSKLKLVSTADREFTLHAVVEGDFRKNEATLYKEWLKGSKNVEPTDADSVVLFLSRTQNQMVFVHGYDTLSTPYPKPKRTVLWSERLRLDRGTWNPLMLVNYAELVGLHLVGLKRFEDFYKKLVG